MVTPGTVERLSHRRVVRNLRALVDGVAKRCGEHDAREGVEAGSRGSCQRGGLAPRQGGVGCGFFAELDDEWPIGGDVPWSTPYLCVCHPEALLDVVHRSFAGL